MKIINYFLLKSHPKKKKRNFFPCRQEKVDISKHFLDRVTNGFVVQCREQVEGFEGRAGLSSVINGLNRVCCGNNDPTRD